MKRNLLWLIAAVLLFGCSEQMSDVPLSPGALPISLTGSIAQLNVTRANEHGFANGDRMGIYIVDYVDGEAGKLHASENRASNLIYTFDGETHSWKAHTTIYWRDKTTPVDVYGYYPAANYISNPSAYHFEVSANQNQQHEGEMGSYEASDFLWGKTANTSPTTETIMLRYSHRLAGVRVQLIKREGLTDAESEKLPRLVTVDNTLRTANIDLASGTATPTGSYDHPIRMLEQAEDYRAVIIPQTVEAGKPLISITIGGITYSHTLTSPMKYQAGRLHNFTITVNKSEVTGDYSFSVKDDGITAWMNDQASHQFSTQAYVIVDCDKPGTLRDCIKRAGLDYKTIQNLKVTGELTSSDFYFMRDNMPKLTNLNLREVHIKKGILNRPYSTWQKPAHDFTMDNVIPDEAFLNNRTLHSIILPAKLTHIGAYSFAGMDLQHSTFEIPDGVTYIGQSAFMTSSDNIVSSTVDLVLPLSLDSIEQEAFAGCNFRCDFRLSDRVKYIGPSAFSGSVNFYGTFFLPPNVELNGHSFNSLGSKANKLKGHIEIPQNAREIPEGCFSNMGFQEAIDLFIPPSVKKINAPFIKNTPLRSLTLSEGLEEIGRGAFWETSLPFQVDFPSSLRRIGPSAFSNSHLSGKLVLNNQMEKIEDGTFRWTDIEEAILPERITSIGQDAFECCYALRKVTLPRYLDFIGDGAFYFCQSIRTLVSLNPEPPRLIGDRVFEHVDMDNCILEVPEQSIELYRHAEGWSKFRNITPHYELAVNVPVFKTLSKGGTCNGLVRAESPWEITECPSWCHVEPLRGDGYDEILISVDAQSASAAQREGKIVFRLRDKEYTTSTAIVQYASQWQEDEIIVLQEATAAVPHSVPLFIVGEGFDAGDVMSGKYMEVMHQYMEYFFSIEPFKSYRDRFSVKTAIAVSPEQGLESKEFGIVNNRFGTGYINYTQTMSCRPELVHNYIRQNLKLSYDSRPVEELMTLVVCNEPWARGKTHNMIDGSSVAYVCLSPDTYPYDARGFVLHYACGQGFGKLGSENVEHFTFLNSCTCPNCNEIKAFKEAKERGWYANLSLTGKTNEVPWSHLIYHPRYSSLVDVYEGGYRHARGVFRSEPQSVMSTFVPYFNTISRETIVRHIMEQSGEDYSFEKFVENDIIETPEQ